MTAYASTPAFKQEGFLAVAEDSAGQAPRAADRAARTVHLTFDAEHPDQRHHRGDGAEALLDVLAARGATATFFLQGRWASANPETARRVAREGHTIGSHSNTHLYMTRLSDSGLVAEVKESEERIHAVTGVDPRPYFRCPYGDGHDDERVVAALSALHYRVVGWDVDPRDWDPALNADDLVAAVEDGLQRAPETPVVLMHTWPAWTSSAVERLLESAGDQVRWAPLTRAAAV
jgi:peptidoglycan/xylan/chitin deacetylase (PgdA/CDA1 family)